MESFAAELDELLSRCDEFEEEDRKKAARNLANAEVFLIPHPGLDRAYPLYWLLHIRGEGKSFSDTKRSNQNLSRYRSDLSKLGYAELSETDVRFEQAWINLVAACSRLNTAPSNRKGRPNWSGRRIFYPASSGCLAMSLEQMTSKSGVEGASIQVSTNRYERDVNLRNACVSYHRTRDDGRLICQVCKLDFFASYGAIGEGFIHVHHVDPLGNRQSEHLIDPHEDLKPVCPNCHAMLHKKPGREAYSLQEIRDLLGENDSMPK